MASVVAISDAEYHGDKQHVTRGMLADFRDSPRLFHRWHVAQTAKKPEPKNPRVGVGEAAHKALLQPHLFESIVREIPAAVLSKSGSKAGGAWKEWSAQWNAGTVLLKSEEYAAAKEMAAVIDEQFGWLLRKASRIEDAVYWEWAGGIDCKCKPDILIFAQPNLIVDLKTGGNCAPDAFRKRVADGYWLQAAHYTEGVKALTGGDADFLFLAIDDKGNPPACYRLDGDAMAKANDEWRRTMNALAEARDTDNWRCLWEGMITDLPLGDLAFTSNLGDSQ